MAIFRLTVSATLSRDLREVATKLAALDTLAVTYKVWTTTVALVMPMPESMISVIASGLTVPLNFAAVRTEEGWG